MKLNAAELIKLQRDQYAHDMRNHFDIVSLHKTDRLKHYGLHFAKYVGRLARGEAEPKSVTRTLVDTLLVALSAANTLHQDLSAENFPAQKRSRADILSYADASGRFADACEKIDHLEEFVPMARQANRDIVLWAVDAAEDQHLDLDAAVQARRSELAARHFYIEK